MNIHELPGIFPAPVEPVAPPAQRGDIRNNADARNISFKVQAMPQNHSSRDRGQHPIKSSPINRSRHGNKR